MILIIDNYDSFTYNLVQYVGEMGFPVTVCRNDKISIQDILKLKPTRIIISPGPGKPKDSGITLDILKDLSDIPILGICLGHQSIGYIYGAQIIKTENLMHGKTSLIFHNSKLIFQDLENPFLATRYHSLIIEKDQLPENLEIIAWTSDNVIMGIVHKQCPHIIGIQFHPESLWTATGKKILLNFLN
uniref:Anthranilate synthase component 2 n=1 Tax=Bangiopsis subsimplex TaxID=139980 RepID=A0A1C9CCY1_9RHOD|nr:anthranilate synthase component 2 [Bangiopsis subsimplex]AOM66235.1 anthranilate synthase component 2 [Bangiopsis subsimplex]ARO90403.1 anthranilate synthase component II [Bangiopsis subsimplex]